MPMSSSQGVNAFELSESLPCFGQLEMCWLGLGAFATNASGPHFVHCHETGDWEPGYMYSPAGGYDGLGAPITGGELVGVVGIGQDGMCGLAHPSLEPILATEIARGNVVLIVAEPCSRHYPTPLCPLSVALQPPIDHPGVRKGDRGGLLTGWGPHGGRRSAGQASTGKTMAGTIWSSLTDVSIRSPAVGIRGDLPAGSMLTSPAP